MNRHTIYVTFPYDLRAEPGYKHNPRKIYSYFSDDDTIEAGDKVIVETTDMGYVVVNVESVQHFITDSKTTRWVIQKLDLTRHHDRQEKIKKAAEIRSRLDKALDEQRKLLDYRKLAEINPKVAALLKDLQALEGDTV